MKYRWFISRSNNNFVPVDKFFFFFKVKIERREKLILSESGNEISMVYFSIGNNFVPVDKLFFFFEGRDEFR